MITLILQITENDGLINVETKSRMNASDTPLERSTEDAIHDAVYVKQNRALDAKIQSYWHHLVSGLIATEPLKYGWLSDIRLKRVHNGTCYVRGPKSLDSITETLFWPTASNRIKDDMMDKVGFVVRVAWGFYDEEVQP